MGASGSDARKSFVRPNRNGRVTVCRGAVAKLPANVSAPAECTSVGGNCTAMVPPTHDNRKCACRAAEEYRGRCGRLRAARLSVFIGTPAQYLTLRCQPASML